MDTLVRKVGSQVPLRVTTSTLQEPSNGAADADVAAEIAEIARAAVIVTTRKEWLIIRDPRVGLKAPSPDPRRPVVVAAHDARDEQNRLVARAATRRGMVSRRRRRKEEDFRAHTLEIRGQPAGRDIMLLWWPTA
jgi:hypothetical protein